MKFVTSQLKVNGLKSRIIGERSKSPPHLPITRFVFVPFVIPAFVIGISQKIRKCKSFGILQRGDTCKILRG